MLKGIRRDTVIGTASRRVLEANSSRVGALLINRAAGAIAIGLGFDPGAATAGIVLAANGGYYEIQLLNPFDGEIWAIGAGAGYLLNITEVSW